MSEQKNTMTDAANTGANAQAKEADAPEQKPAPADKPAGK